MTQSTFSRVALSVAFASSLVFQPNVLAQDDAAAIAVDFEEMLPEDIEGPGGKKLLPMPSDELALPVSGYYEADNGTTRPVSPYAFLDNFFKNHIDELGDPRGSKHRYLLRSLPSSFFGPDNKLTADNFKDVSVYTNHPAPMPRTAPSNHFRICVRNKYGVGAQLPDVDGKVPGIQIPPNLFTTYVRTAPGILPSPKSVGLPNDQPPGTNMLPTVYRNLIDRFGKEIPHTLPSHPNNPYNLHDGPPEVSRLPTHSSPTDDLRYILENLYEDITGESPRRLWEYVEENGLDSKADRKSLYEHLREKVAANMAKDDSLERRWKQMQLHTKWVRDIIEGNSGDECAVPANRAYVGMGLLNHSGHKRIGRIQPLFDKHGHIVGGNVNVHQIWYDGRIQSDTMFYDFGWDDNPDLWKPAAPGVRDALPLPAEVPWTITYTVDVLNNGEDDFSPMTMYFDAPERMKLPFEDMQKVIDRAIDEADTTDEQKQAAKGITAEALKEAEQDIRNSDKLDRQYQAILLSVEKLETGKSAAELAWSPAVQAAVQKGLQDAAKAQVENAVNPNESSNPVPMVFANRDSSSVEPFVKTRSKLGLWNASMDQSFFPMEAGNRYVFKIKMAPAQYFNLTYTWGWRRHPPRAQAGENVHKRVPPRTPEQLGGLGLVEADYRCPRLLPPSLFSQLRISDHERLVFAGLKPGGQKFGDQSAADTSTLPERYQDDPIPMTILIGNASNPGPLQKGYINELLDKIEAEWDSDLESLREVLTDEFRAKWNNHQENLEDLIEAITNATDPTTLPDLHHQKKAQEKALLDMVPPFNSALFVMNNLPQSEIDALRAERKKLQTLRFMVMSNFPFFKKKDTTSKSIDMISDLAPAKRMWRIVGSMKVALAAPTPTTQADRLDFGYEMLDDILAFRSAFLDFQDRTKLPSGLTPDSKSELTMLYVNNTIYGEFRDGGKDDYPEWRKRGDDVKLTLINGDYFPHGYLNVDFGANRGWENQFKPTLAMGGPGIFFSFGRFYWKFNTEPGAIGLPPAVKQEYVADGDEVRAYPVDRVLSQSYVKQGTGSRMVWELKIKSESNVEEIIKLEPGEALVKRLGRNIGRDEHPTQEFYAVVADIVDSGAPTPLSQAGAARFTDEIPDAVRPFVHRVWIQMNHDPGRRLRFYQFDPLHHDVAIYSIH